VEGSITGLIGPNGAGKSTLLEVVSGFQPSDSGSIRFDGREIRNRPAYDVSRRGLIRTFQEAREWPALSVLENVLVATLPLRTESVWRALLRPGSIRHAEDEARSRARDILREFGLYALRNERAGNLSGGQKRLLEFARVACAKPRLVLLDEPHTGVNPVIGARLGAAIRSLRDAGVTVLMVEHNLSFVEQLCDVVWVMNLGEAIATGTMASLRGNDEVVSAYLGSVSVSA
jgi:ABC-type branched-subunit amino acid transport system ATPase component